MDFFNRTRLDAGGDPSKPLPLVYATNWEFIGCMLGVVDHLGSQYETPPNEMLLEIIPLLFGPHAKAAFSTIQVGGSSDELMRALEETEKRLQWIGTLPREQRPEQLRFMQRFF
jgi:hypothetical protein